MLPVSSQPAVAARAKNLPSNMMLQRNLLYTAITRAKKIVVLVGTKKALGIAVRNANIANRNTNLALRLRSKEGSRGVVGVW